MKEPKQSWEIELEKVIIGNIKGAYTLPLTTGYKNSVKAVFSAELLRIKKEIVEELTKAKERTDTSEMFSDEKEMLQEHETSRNIGLQMALEIVERNLL